MAKDRAYHLNAKRLSEMENHLREVYSQASRELVVKHQDYMKRNQPKVDSLYQAYQAAKQNGSKEDIQKALEDYQKKLASVTYKDKWFKDQQNEMAKKISNVNREAVKYINGNMPYVASNGYNQIKDDIDKKMIPGIRWDITNEDTVRLALQGKVKLPERKLSVPKDVRWNKKKMNAELLQGILQGEDIPTIAKRLEKVIGMNRDSSIRAARTMVTQAENLGRYASWVRAEDEGMEIEKTWWTAGDNRVRDTHEALEGMTIPYKDEFPNGCLVPGDGPASEVWNCRCCCTSSVISFTDKNGKKHYV